MSMMKHMISVVMDDIKDAEMLTGYAEDAKIHGADKGVQNWFIARAQNRTSMAERDWNDIDDHIREQKGDGEMLEALECHVEHSIANLKERVEKL